MKIKDLYEERRPREKAGLYGISSLSEGELLALVIGSGTKGKNALECASSLLNGYPSLSSLSEGAISLRLKAEGIGKAKAYALAACFELARRLNREGVLKGLSLEPHDLYLRYRERLSKLRGESLLVIYLDHGNKPLREVEPSRGKSLTFDPKSIIAEGVMLNAKGMVLFHNHPSGISMPSKKDIDSTMVLYKTAKQFNLPIIDHIIIAGEGYFSFAEEGLIKGWD